jgi:hypothetical protein
MFWLISGIGETAKNTAAGITATEGAIVANISNTITASRLGRQSRAAARGTAPPPG